MIFLLDVNSLIALGLRRHEFHERVANWLRSEGAPTLATCSITELGFARVLAQGGAYGLSLTEAFALLLGLKGSGRFRWVFFADALGVAQSPAWVKRSSQLTDGHLLQLAKAHGGVLATLDEKIPGAFLLPR